MFTSPAIQGEPTTTWGRREASLSVGSLSGEQRGASQIGGSLKTPLTVRGVSTRVLLMVFISATGVR